MPGRPKKQAKTISTWKLFADPEFWETAFKLMAAGESIGMQRGLKTSLTMLTRGLLMLTRRRSVLMRESG